MITNLLNSNHSLNQPFTKLRGNYNTAIYLQISILTFKSVCLSSCTYITLQHFIIFLAPDALSAQNWAKLIVQLISKPHYQVCTFKSGVNFRIYTCQSWQEKFWKFWEEFLVTWSSMKDSFGSYILPKSSTASIQKQ